MSKFNIYKVDNKISTTTNATPEAIIASQIGEAIIGDFSMDNSFRAAIVGSEEDTFETMQNENQALGTLDMTPESAAEWMTKLSKIYESIIDTYSALIDAQESLEASLDNIATLSKGEKKFEDLVMIAEDIECVPDLEVLNPLHDIFRGCLQERYKFKFNK